MKKLLIGLVVLFGTGAYADTETINWYVDGSVYNTTTCQTGGNITLQTAPAKRGHTFTGWQVALYDFSTLDASIEGINNTQDALNRTWSTAFSYGIVYGVSLCSITLGAYPYAGTPDESTSGGQCCWCKATGFVPSGNNILYENTSSSSWVYHHMFDLASDCANSCTYFCGYNVQHTAPFRQSIFGITQ